MSLRAEPLYTHGSASKTAVVFCNLGTPDAPTAAALRRYLAQFLSDARVIEIPKLIWALILHGIILRVRPAKSAAKYASVWMPGGSPLKVWTETQARLLQASLQQRGHDVTVRYAMRYGNPAIGKTLSELCAEGVTRVLVLPAYPQYSAATTASVVDDVARWALQTRHLPEFRFVNRYGDDPQYIEALADSVRKHWEAKGRPERLVMSFHGMPARTLELGDPYHCECLKTGRLLAEALSLTKEQYSVTFQSRFGRAKWLQPYTEPTLKKLASEGTTNVDVICPGFSADCLETLEEISMEARDAFLAAGGRQFSYIPCLNDSDAGMAALTALTERHLLGWPTQQTQDPQQLQAQRLLAMAAGASQ